MADAPVNTQPAAAPTGPNVPSTLSRAPGAGWGPDELAQLAKLNWQTENFLAGDKETLTNLSSNYNRALQGLSEQEGTGFKTLRSRNFASGLENSGFALGSRQELASRYTNRRGAEAEKLQQNYNKIGRGIQEREGSIGLQMGGLDAKAQALREKQARERALEAPQGTAGAGTPGGAYPGATSAVNAAFPGGTAEQRAWIKWQAAGGKGKAPGVIAVEPQPNSPRAKGGPVMPGRAYTVGERGKELFVPKVPGRIVPNNRMAAIRKALRGRR